MASRLVTVSALLLILVVSSLVVQASVDWDDCYENFVDNDSYYPYRHPNTTKICRGEDSLAILYDGKMLNPAFSAYYITPDNCDDYIKGRLSFYDDPNLEDLGVPQATVDNEIFSSTWNRGHLAPSKMMSYSETSKKSCYTMANIAPQYYYFNQHPWQQLEAALFDWVEYNAPLHIMTGVAYKNYDYPNRTQKGDGFDGVVVPDYFWTVFCDMESRESAGIFATNTEYSEGSDTFVTVEEVEKIYGGKLLPTKCNTDWVNYSHWWEFSSQEEAVKRAEDKKRRQNEKKMQKKKGKNSKGGSWWNALIGANNHEEKEEDESRHPIFKYVKKIYRPYGGKNQRFTNYRNKRSVVESTNAKGEKVNVTLRRGQDWGPVKKNVEERRKQKRL